MYSNQILKKGIFDTLIFMQMENSKNYIFSLLDNNHPLTWILKTLKRGCNTYVWYSNVWFTVCFASRFPEKVQSGVPIASGGVKIRDFPTILSTLTLNSDQKKNNLHTCYSLSVYICYTHSKSKFCVNYPVPKRADCYSKEKW